MLINEQGMKIQKTFESSIIHELKVEGISFFQKFSLDADLHEDYPKRRTAIQFVVSSGNKQMKLFPSIIFWLIDNRKITLSALRKYSCYLHLYTINSSWIIEFLNVFGLLGKNVKLGKNVNELYDNKCEWLKRGNKLNKFFAESVWSKAINITNKTMARNWKEKSNRD